MPCTARWLLAAVVSGSILVVPVAAAADGGTESQFVSATNSARASHGLPAYAVAGDLTSVARRWAAHMAAHEQLEHNPSFTSEVCCWSQVGENVGVGPNVSAIQRAFMASSPHRANILSSSYTQVGIGTARGSDGRLYVDEIFRRPTHAASRAAHPAVPHAATAPAVHSRPQPARASRSAVRRPPARPVHVPSARQLFLVRLEAARQVDPGAYVDPVGGAVAYVRLMQKLGG
jgi:hypothetical protein